MWNLVVRTDALLAIVMMSVVALAGCSSSEDSDNDGLLDGEERRGWQTLVYDMEESREIEFRSDPKKADTDGDGLSDWDETFVRGNIGPRLNPSDPDTDGDGLTDCQEWYIQLDGKRCPVPEGFQDYDYESYETHPSFVDSDFPSHSRYIAGTANGGAGYFDHEGFQSSGGTYLWGDGISDYDEIFGYDIQLENGSTIADVRTNPRLLDSDEDGLEDGEETFKFLSHPLQNDTDGDGCIDGIDVFPTKHDSYRVAVDRFHLTDAPTGSNQVRLFMPVAIAAATDADSRFYPSVGHIDVVEGSTVDISHLTQDFVKRSDCSGDERSFHVVSANRPWIFMQAPPLNKAADAPDSNEEAFARNNWTAIDVQSHTALPGVHRDRIYWNPIHDSYRFAPPEYTYAYDPLKDPVALLPDENGWLHMVGDEGEIWFRGEVSLFLPS